jgi:hypothetical protein
VPCAQVGAIVEIQDDDGGRVFWNNAVVGIDGTIQNVAATITIDWAPVPVADADRLDREIDYDADGPAPYSELLWCTSFSQSVDMAGKVTLTGVAPNIGVGTPGANADGTAPWCLVSNDEDLNGNLISQTQVLYGSGDPWMR